MERKTGRVHLSYCMIGSQDVAVTGQKPPIVFLHGATSAKETWRKVIRPIAVATSRKAYAYDARNHGDSGWSNDFSYEILRDDLVEFMDGLHVQRAVLVGHSMGGKTAMFFATKMPERVEKLIIEDISPKPAKPHLRKSAQKYVELLKNILEQIPLEIKDLEKAKDFAQDYLQGKVPEDQRSSRHGTIDGSSLPLAQDEDGTFKWKTNLKVIGENFFSVPNTENITCVYSGPTLILYGTKSPYKVSGDREFIRRIFPDSQFRAVEGATHNIHLEYEDIFVKEVAEFINDS